MNKKQLKPDRMHVQEKVTEILGDGILDCEEVDITARKVVDYIWPMVRYQADSKATMVDPGGRMWHDLRLFGNRVGLEDRATETIIIEPAPRDWSGRVLDAPDWVKDFFQHEGVWYFSSERLSSIQEPQKKHA